tara:strand:+ start:5500 stop:6189 length:690 start_codon:yes stop_codon:yes gene_type:complete
MLNFNKGLNMKNNRKLVFLILVTSSPGWTQSDTQESQQISLSLQSKKSVALTLNMPRQWGDEDISGHANMVIVDNADPEYETYYEFTDISAKSINVNLASELSSGNLTISLKYIPSDSLQTSDILTSDFLTLSQIENHISAEVDGKRLENTQPSTSRKLCNHIVATLENGKFRLNHNNVWVDFNGTVPTSLKSNDITFGEFPGQVWDIQLYDGVLSDDEIKKLSQCSIA